jgi:hypothetical protein
MAPNGKLSGQPGNDWRQRTLAEIAGLAAQDASISGFHAHGSASGTAASADSWSDLDVLITAASPGGSVTRYCDWAGGQVHGRAGGVAVIGGRAALGGRGLDRGSPSST